MNKISTPKFDPEENQHNVYEAFCDFVEEFAYEYDAIAKEPPKDLDATQTTAWIGQNKRKIFLGKFASRNLQKDFEEAVASEERSTISYDTMITTMKQHYDGGRNKTLANFEFRKLNRGNEESMEAFAIRVKREAAKCDFTCASPNCYVPQTMMRDQILYGVVNDEIQKNGLKNQWKLAELIKNGRALEAASWGTKQLKQERDVTASVSRTKKPGMYSRKSRMSFKQPTQSSNSKSDEKRESCTTCSNKSCKGGKHCVAHGMECFDCGKGGHFRGAASCKGKPKPSSRRVNTRSSSEGYLLKQ